MAGPYFVSAATGNDADDGLSEGNAWLTIDKAMNTVAAGEKVWVKADGNYNETATIDTAGLLATPITFEGYTTTTGDGGQVTIDGQSTRASGILDSLAAGTRLYYVFKNFIITGHTSHGVNTDGSHTVWKNCKFNSNGTTSGAGFNGRQAMFEGCEFSDNTLDGCNIGTLGAAVFVGCRFYRNTLDGLDCGVGCVCYGCEFFSNGANAINAGQANDAGGLVALFNCTIDGDADDTTIGVAMGSGIHIEAAIVNCCIYDCATGLSAGHGAFENHISRNNLNNGNTDPEDGFVTPTGEVTTAPSFQNEAGLDYRPAAGSPLLDAGYDAASIEGRTARMDIGAIQLGAGAGGGGAGPNKRGNKQT